jgi:hypothetical protein
VARPGQHKGKVEVVSVNFTPWLVMLFFKAGIAFSVPGNWSSVKTKMMLGGSLGASATADRDLAEPIPVTSATTLARRIAVIIEANCRTFPAILSLSSLRGGKGKHRRVTTPRQAISLS